MPIFRFHRGTLAESMRTCVTVKDKQELLERINCFNSWTGKPISKEDTGIISPMVDYLVIKPYSFDSRTGWETQIVLANNRCVTQDPWLIGFLSEPFQDKDKVE